MRVRLTAAARASIARDSRRVWRLVTETLDDWSQPAHLIVDARRRRRVDIAVWVIAVALTLMGFATAETFYDQERVAGGVLPFVGALAGLPFGLVLTRPMLGWLVSVVGAFLVALLLPVRDSDPWPWPTVHGLVLLALLFVVSARERSGRVLGAWLTTCALFAWGVPSDIRAGWVVAVSTVVVIGLLTGRLVRTNRALIREEAGELQREGPTCPARGTGSDRPRPARHRGPPHVARRGPGGNRWLPGARAAGVRTKGTRVDQRVGPRGARRDPHAAVPPPQRRRARGTLTAAGARAAR